MTRKEFNFYCIQLNELQKFRYNTDLHVSILESLKLKELILKYREKIGFWDEISKENLNKHAKNFQPK